MASGLVTDLRPCGQDWLLRLGEEENADAWQLRVPERVRAELTRRKRRFLSQEHQDAIVQRVFTCVGTTNRFFVEFGFNEPGYGMDGGPFNRSSGAQTHMLFELGWRGLLLDGAQENASINLRRHFLFQSNIAGLFTQYAVPKELDFLSVDMDSHDLFVLRAILRGGWRPRLFSAEFNRYYGNMSKPLALLDPTLESGEVPANFRFRYANCSWGTSAHALRLLAEEFGYTPIARVTAVDLFFLRNDLLAAKPVPDWKALFEGFRWPPPKYVPGHQGQPPARDPSMLDRLVDYAVYRQTGSVPAAIAAGRQLLKHLSTHSACWKPLKRYLAPGGGAA